MFWDSNKSSFPGDPNLVPELLRTEPETPGVYLQHSHTNACEFIQQNFLVSKRLLWQVTLAFESGLQYQLSIFFCGRTSSSVRSQDLRKKHYSTWISQRDRDQRRGHLILHILFPNFSLLSAAGSTHIQIHRTSHMLKDRHVHNGFPRFRQSFRFLLNKRSL